MLPAQLTSNLSRTSLVQPLIGEQLVSDVGLCVTDGSQLSSSKRENDGFKHFELDVPVNRIIEKKEIIPLWLSEKQTIEAAIKQCDGNVPKAAALLDISASTIYRKRQHWEEQQNVISGG